MSGLIFVDREKELADLEKFYELGIQGTIGGIIIYGWRKVGKSTLIDKFLEDKAGFRINCAWISDPETFAAIVKEKIRDLVGENQVVKDLAIHIHEVENPLLLLRKTFESINKLSELVGKKIIMALDEVHKFIEKMATRIARETKKKKEIARSDILWMLKDIIEEKKVFWILLSSIGWIKLREILNIKSVEENPLLGLLIKYEIEPFTYEATRELIKTRNPSIPEDITREIHRITGGIPLLIDLIASTYNTNQNLIDTVIYLVGRGVLDEFFENILKFVAEAMKRDYTIVLKVLKAFKKDYTTPEETAKSTLMDRTSAYIILEELHKCGILKKEKKGKEVKYKILYPLLSFWIDLRGEPQKRILDAILSRLGITAEYYVQELLKKYEGKELVLWDDNKGTFLLGTAKQIKYQIKKVYSLEETRKIIGHKNTDIIIELKNEEYLTIEIKATMKNIEPQDINALIQAKEELEKKLNTKIHTCLILMGTGKPTLPAIREAITNNTPIITPEGIKLLAKKAKMPAY